MTSPPTKKSPGRNRGNQSQPAAKVAANGGDATAAFLKAYSLFSAETVAEIQRRGLLSMPSHGLWRHGDDHNGSTRSLNGRKYIRNDNKGDDWHKLIGLRDVAEHDRRNVVFVLEGSKDAMAAFELAHRAGIMEKIGVVTALGSGYRPITAELLLLRGRKVFIVGDRDHAGMESVRRISNALCHHGINHVAFNWNSFPNFDGKDLFDLLESSNAGNVSDGKNASWYSEFFSFFSPSFSTSSVLPLYLLCSACYSSDSSVLSVSPFICTAKGQGHGKLFDLARACKKVEHERSRKLGGSELSQIFEAWWQPSAQHIKSSKSESFARFIDLLRRKVRFVPGAAVFSEAAARARSLPLPDIGINDLPLRKLAALCRELQREQGPHLFFCSVDIARAFTEVSSKSVAWGLLRTLEQIGVIECVKRGVPGEPGSPATRYRYLLPL
jgi:hypothetical protein